MTNFDIVKKLIGDIHPVGETYTDEERFENIRAMALLAEEIIAELEKEIKNDDRYEYSIKRSGTFAKKWFKNIGETYFEQHLKEDDNEK